MEPAKIAPVVSTTYVSLPISPSVTTVQNDLEKTKRLLAEFLKCSPFCLDGLHGATLGSVLDVLLLQFALPFCKSQEAKLIELSVLLKEKTGAQIDAFFKEAPPTAKRGIIWLKLLSDQKSCHAMPVAHFVEAPHTLDRVKTFKDLLSLQEQLLALIEPASAKIKKELIAIQTEDKAAVRSLQNPAHTIDPSLGISKQKVVEYSLETEAKFTWFFGYNGYHLSRVKRDCSNLGDLTFTPSIYSMLNYFLFSHQKPLQKMVQAAEDLEQYTKRLLIDCECTMVPHQRSPESIEKIKRHAYIHLEPRFLYLEGLADYFKYLGRHNETFPVFKKMFRFLKSYMEKREALLEGTCKTSRFDQWLKSELENAPPFYKQLLEFHDSLIKKLLSSQAEKVNKWRKENAFIGGKMDEENEQLEFFSAIIPLYEDMVEEAEKLPNHGSVNFSHELSATFTHAAQGIREFVESPLGIATNIELFDKKLLEKEKNVQLSAYKADGYVYYKTLFELAGKYHHLVSLASYFFVQLAEAQPFKLAQAEAEAKNASVWLLSKAVDKVRKQHSQPKRLKTYRPSWIYSIETQPKKESAKKKPEAVLHPGLYFVRDLLTAQNILFPNQLVGKTDLDPALLADSDQAFHLVCIESTLHLLEQAVKTGRGVHIPLLMARLLNHLYLAEEQAARDPEKEEHGLKNKAVLVPFAREMNLTTFWWRYLHSSCDFYKERGLPLPEGLHFLCQLHQEGRGWTPMRLEIIRAGLKFFMDQAAHSDLPERAAQHLQKEKEKLISRFDSLVSSLPAEALSVRQAPSVSFKEMEAFKQALSASDYSKKPRALSAAALDLKVHLERLEQSLQLLNDFPSQDDLGIHMIQILTACQYIYEHMGVMISIRLGEEIHTHNLMYYAKAFKYEQILTSQDIEEMKKVNLRKGSDYPHQEFYKRQARAPQGLKWLSEAFQFTVEARIVGSGFIPAGLKDSLWAKDHLPTLNKFVESQVRVMLKIFQALESFKSEPAAPPQVILRA